MVTVDTRSEAISHVDDAEPWWKEIILYVPVITESASYILDVGEYNHLLIVP